MAYRRNGNCSEIMTQKDDALASKLETVGGVQVNRKQTKLSLVSFCFLLINRLSWREVGGR